MRKTISANKLVVLSSTHLPTYRSGCNLRQQLYYLLYRRLSEIFPNGLLLTRQLHGTRNVVFRTLDDRFYSKKHVLYLGSTIKTKPFILLKTNIIDKIKLFADNKIRTFAKKSTIIQITNEQNIRPYKNERIKKFIR